FAQLRDAKKWPYFYFVERRLLDACSAVVYSSECEQRHTIAAARHRTSEIVIPDFFEAEPALPDIRGVVADEVRFSFMAAIAPRKGSLPLVEGFVEFARAIGPGEKVRLVVAGFVRRGSEAYHARELAIAARAPANAAIEFIGPVKDADRASFYRDTDVFLVPSVFESFGLTVLEGVAAGCAEITGPELGVLEYLPADSGLTIAQAISPAAIAEALRVRYELARSQRRSEREATRTRAASAIADLNGLAKARWLELLSG
ncbi:MAG: glycosyltransferase family 4 protein, partial [Porphyrobacter sp.]|nr:glycosyltransferase family 4 protein [Porphyrobacter sp.]